MANENDWLVTAAEVGAETTQTTVAIDGLDAVFASCASFTPAQQAAWASFRQQYNLFIDGVNKTMFGGISWAWQSSILSEVRGWQATVAGWQKIAASQCAYSGPGPYVNPPPGPSNDTLWTVVKWGGIAALGAWAALTVAPIVGGAIARAKIVGAATKRVYGAVRGRQNPVY